jgi:hypothetical protein
MSILLVSQYALMNAEGNAILHTCIYTLHACIRTVYVMIFSYESTRLKTVVPYTDIIRLHMYLSCIHAAIGEALHESYAALEEEFLR